MNLKQDMQTKPNIFLCHGDDDQVVPFSRHRHSAKALNDMDFPVEEYIMKGAGHTITMSGLKAAKKFLRSLV